MTVGYGLVKHTMVFGLWCNKKIFVNLNPLALICLIPGSWSRLCWKRYQRVILCVISNKHIFNKKSLKKFNFYSLHSLFAENHLKLLIWDFEFWLAICWYFFTLLGIHRLWTLKKTLRVAKGNPRNCCNS